MSARHPAADDRPGRPSRRVTAGHGALVEVWWKQRRDGAARRLGIGYPGQISTVVSGQGLACEAGDEVIEGDEAHAVPV